jgi:hypothetical protein
MTTGMDFEPFVWCLCALRDVVTVDDVDRDRSIMSSFFWARSFGIQWSSDSSVQQTSCLYRI